MNPVAHQLAQRGIDLALAFNAVETGKGRTLDTQREMAFAARIMAGMPDVLMALILQMKAGGGQRGGQPLDHFAGDRSGGSLLHRTYIGEFKARGTSGDTANQMAWADRGIGAALLRARMP